MWISKTPVLLPDGKIISNTAISATGTMAAIDTINYQSLTIQISGTSQITLIVEGSNDQNYYQPLYTLDSDDLALNDVITSDGIYSLQTTTRYVRFNTTNITGTAQVVVLGRSGQGVQAADRISSAMDDNTKNALHVKVDNFPLMDALGAFVPSDAPKSIYWNSPNASSPLTIDTTGYNSIVIHQLTVGIVTVTASNDGLNFVSIVGTSEGSTTPAFNTTGVGIFVFPTHGKYIRLVGPATSVQAYIFLRSSPYIPQAGIVNPPVNIAMLAGTTLLSGGTTGSLGIGGLSAVGVAPTGNPVSVTGIDGQGVARRPYMDNVGRLQIATTDFSNISRGLTVLTGNPSGAPAIAVQDVTTHEGSSVIQILASILLELQINNFYICQLPLMIQTGQVFMDQPQDLRNEPSLFQP